MTIWDFMNAHVYLGTITVMAVAWWVSQAVTLTSNGWALAFHRKWTVQGLMADRASGDDVEPTECEEDNCDECEPKP